MSSKGIIPTATEKTESPADSSWKTERLASLKRDQAAILSDLSAYQIQMLEKWHCHFFGEWPPETMSPDELGKLFLDATPVQWPRAWRRPITIKETVEEESPREDGTIAVEHTRRTRTFEPKTVDDIDRAIRSRFGGEPGLTVRVLAYSFRNGPDFGMRGELLFLRGHKEDDRVVEQAIDLGLYENVTQHWSTLGACPMPGTRDRVKPDLPGYPVA